MHTATEKERVLRQEEAYLAKVQKRYPSATQWLDHIPKDRLALEQDSQGVVITVKVGVLMENMGIFRDYLIATPSDAHKYNLRELGVRLLVCVAVCGITIALAPSSKAIIIIGLSAVVILATSSLKRYLLLRRAAIKLAAHLDSRSQA